MTPRHPLLKDLLAHWDGTGNGHAMPDWRDTDRLSLRRWMGNLNVIEVIDGGLDFYCRLHGSNLVAITGSDATGRLYSDLTDIDAGILIEECRSVFLARRPRLTARKPLAERKHYIELEKLILPYTNGGEECGIILTGTYVLESRQPELGAGSLLGNEALH